MTISENHRRQLHEWGYAALPDFVDSDWLDQLRMRVDELFQLEGEAAGSEFKQEPGCGRLANLVNKGEIFHRVIGSAEILEYVRLVLGSAIKLSSHNARRVPAGCDVRQPLHCDMGAVADEQGDWVCNTVWMLDDFTEENGPIRVVPGTHRSEKLPEEELEDPLAAHPEEVLLTGTAGTVVVMNAHLWHGGTENKSTGSRTALHAFYCRRDKPQQQYQKQLVEQRVQASLTPDLRELLALDDPRNDELCLQPTTRSGFLK